MKKLSWYLIATLLVVLPWHAFLKTWLSSLFLGAHADFLPVASNVFSLWKEILVFVSVLILLFYRTAKAWKETLHNKNFLLLLLLSISIILFGVSQAPNSTAIVLGLRTDLLFILAVIAGFLSQELFSPQQVKTLVRLSTISLIATFSIFIFSWIFIPDIGLYFGYSPYQSSYVENKPLPLYLCIFVQDHCIPRLQASFSGPNQAGSMAILLGGLLLYLQPTWWIFLIPLIGLLLTFSRSAFIGGAVLFLATIPKKWLWRSIAALVAGIVLSTIVVPDFITHGLSSSEHWTKTIDGIQRIIAHPWGTGLGSAGPVSRRIFGEGGALISENWYLQIGEEAGILSMLLLLFTTGYFIWQLLRSSHRLSRIVGMILLATSLEALFLHLWEDSVVTLLIWFWVGIGLCYNNNEHIPTYGK